MHAKSLPRARREVTRRPASPGVDVGTAVRGSGTTTRAAECAGGRKAPHGFLDGTSFAANLRGSPNASDPQEILLRGCRTIRGGNEDCGGYPTNMGFAWGLRTKKYKYVEYPDGYVQLFDLKTDPYELTNLAPDPGHASVVTDLKARLARLRKA